MASYHQEPPVTQGWDRWQPHNASPDYVTMDGMVAYDTRAVPTTNALQRPTMSPQYSLPTTYAESPVTPMSASPYGSQAPFGDYQPYSYHTPATSTPYNQQQLPLRHSQRPMAPPTPPLEDERGVRMPTVKSSVRRASRRSVSVVKSEAGGETREIKTCPKYVKKDGSLQHESNKTIDKFLRLVKTREAVLPVRTKPEAATPESMAGEAGSPPPAEEEPGRSQPKKAKKCRWCPKTFAQNAQLQTHERAHSGEKPFECKICGKHVSQPGNLKAHMRRHTGETPYECRICNARFASNGGMKVHVRNKHEGEPKKICPIPNCGKSFTTIGNMKVHIDKFHEPMLIHYMEMIAEHDPSQPFPEDVAELWGTLLILYKNSNCGIKGRGVDDPEIKALDKRLKQEPGARLEMTPVSPEATGHVTEYRQYYDQQQQQHYHAVLPHPAQQAQQQSSYMQLPVHQPQQPMYHTLPQPGSYNMGWAQTPQYH